MCELFGVSSPEKTEINHLLRAFFSHGTEHPDGWGIAFFSGNEVALEKQPLNACSSMYLKSRLRVIHEADKMIAHIRLATKGTNEYENTHPFVRKDACGRNWTLAHNGTIFESKILEPMFYEQEGHTDSERILIYIIHKINEALKSLPHDAFSLTAEARFRVVDRILCDITPGNKVNLILYDGELFYIHTNYRNSLYFRPEKNALFFSTRPLDLKPWEALPLNTLLAFRNGVPVFTGTNHGNEFFDDEAKLQHLFLDYAAL